MHRQTKFNIRVYGILEWGSKILLSEEFLGGKCLTKFPGGGLEWGEGIVDALKREFMEELGISIAECRLFHINGHFQPSVFNPADQIISVYYRVKYPEPESIPVKINPYEFDVREHGSQVFRWVERQGLDPAMFYFPIDKDVAIQLKANNV